MNREKLLAKLVEKWPAKVLSVAAALIISIIFRMNTLEIRSFSVPLNVIENESLIPAGSFIDSVRVSLRGETNDIHTILESDIEAFIDLNKYTSGGLVRVPVQLRKKGSALGVEPLEISVIPVEIQIQLEEIITRNIQVFPAFQGAIAQDYELTSQSITPDSVTARGPRFILNNIVNFTTEVIDLNDRFEDLTVFVSVINENPLVTIQGSGMIEYNGTVRRIDRYVHIIEEPQVIETDEDEEEEE